MSNLTIPCELCGANVIFDAYIVHLEMCQSRSTILNLLNPILADFVGRNENMESLRLEDITDEYQLNSIIGEIIGNVNQGVKDYEGVLSVVEGELVGESKCIICMESFEDLVNVRVMRTSCNHMFCELCIKRWLMQNSSCPLCKHEFNE
jgi:hypothetical protein